MLFFPQKVLFVRCIWELSLFKARKLLEWQIPPLAGFIR